MPCRSLTSLRNKFRAVIFFYRHLLSPIASIFGSGMLCAARTFLSSYHEDQRHAGALLSVSYQSAKVQKTFEKKRTFLTYFLYFTPIRITKALLSVHKKGFSKTVLLIVFCTLQNINSIFTTMHIKQSVEYL